MVKLPQANGGAELSCDQARTLAIKLKAGLAVTDLQARQDAI
jgi:hypothetical protein